MSKLMPRVPRRNQDGEGNLLQQLPKTSLVSMAHSQALQCTIPHPHTQQGRENSQGKQGAVTHLHWGTAQSNLSFFLAALGLHCISGVPLFAAEGFL